MWIAYIFILVSVVLVAIIIARESYNTKMITRIDTILRSIEDIELIELKYAENLCNGINESNYKSRSFRIRARIDEQRKTIKNVIGNAREIIKNR